MISNLASFFFHQIREAEQERDRVYEPVIGVVTDNRDPEKLLRVKVRLPSLGPDSTFWIPVVAMGAGKERGWFFLPEINDEVLVAFEHGDVNHPVVIGSLWNGKDKPPESNPGSNPKRVLVSRAGSRIEFDDEKNTITIEDAGGNGSIVFKADDNKLTIEAKRGDLVIMCPQGELKVYAEGNIELNAKMNFEIRGDQKVQLGAASGLTLKASGMTSIMAGAVDLNPGGVPEAAEVSGEVSELPDPVGGGGGGGGGGSSGGAAGSSGGSASGSGGGGGGSSGTAGGGGSTPAPAPGRAPGPGAATGTEPEPEPALVSAAWERSRAPASTEVRLRAACAQLDGKAATFTIKDADSGKTVATVSGTCGASSAEATWKTPADGPPSQFLFDVEADGKKATSGLLTLVKRVEATLVLDEEPAEGVKVALRCEPSGELLEGTADAKGAVVFEEAPVGKFTLALQED